MPITVPNELPATKVLKKEGIFAMYHSRAVRQDIRPLRVAILNLMPKKIETEIQLLRVLSNSALQVDVDLIQTSSYTPKNTPTEYLTKYYNTFAQVKDKYYDGLIITGAPVEKLPFEQVEYWEEICHIMEWSKTNVYSTFHICWGAQVALYYHYGIKKYLFDEKLSGVFSHTTENINHRLIQGFDDVFMAPHSRFSEVRKEDIISCKDLDILSYSKDAGVYIVADKTSRQFFVTGHSEYDKETLAKEYLSDIDSGLNVSIPKNYFPDDNVLNSPNVTWRGHGNLLYSNWLNYFVYQKTPYDLKQLKKEEKKEELNYGKQ